MHTPITTHRLIAPLLPSWQLRVPLSCARHAPITAAARRLAAALHLRPVAPVLAVSVVCVAFKVVLRVMCMALVLYMVCTRESLLTPEGNTPSRYIPKLGGKPATRAPQGTSLPQWPASI